MFNHREMRTRHPRKIFGFVILGAAALGALGFLTMSLWNALMPVLFGLKVLHFWQALGLLALCRILFGGFHHRHGRGFGPGLRHRQQMLQRWERMSPEEREKFKQGFRSRFGNCSGRDTA